MAGIGQDFYGGGEDSSLWETPRRQSGQTLQYGLTAAQFADPWKDMRKPAQERYTQLMNDPSSIAQNPAYQFRMKQGTENLLRAGKNARGGRLLAELQDYGQGQASQEFYNLENMYGRAGGRDASSPAAAALAYARSYERSQDQANMANANKAYGQGKGGGGGGGGGGQPQSFADRMAADPWFSDPKNKSTYQSPMPSYGGGGYSGGGGGGSSYADQIARNEVLLGRNEPSGYVETNGERSTWDQGTGSFQPDQYAGETYQPYDDYFGGGGDFYGGGGEYYGDGFSGGDFGGGDFYEPTYDDYSYEDYGYGE